MEPLQHQRRFSQDGCRVVIAAVRPIDSRRWLAETRRLTDEPGEPHPLVGTPAQIEIMQLTAEGATPTEALDRLELAVRGAIAAAVRGTQD